MKEPIDFQTDPSRYRHWRVDYDGAIANIYMDVDDNGGLFDGYDLKLNSYDLGVDIELADIVERMRFEHPEVKVVILQSGKDRVFCAGANIRMLGGASHSHKVNFCKFTNETRNALESAEADSGQKYIAAIKGACAGGGYELALACNYIMLTDDRNTSVSLPEVPLLAVLPGTGGLTRLTDKRKVRRDLADVFCSTEEGVKGKRAQEWRLVDEVITNSIFDQTVLERAGEFAATSDKSDVSEGIALTDLERTFECNGNVKYSAVNVEFDRASRKAIITIFGPDSTPSDIDSFVDEGADTYLLRLARELDDAILHLRLNELELGLLVFRSQGNHERLIVHEMLLLNNAHQWLVNEVLQLWKRVLKRIDITSRSMIATIEHGSCFSGILAEILFAVDRSYMMKDEFEDDDRPFAHIALTDANFGMFPMANGLSRLQTRFLGDQESLEAAMERKDESLDADDAEGLGLVTMSLDELDWEDELRIFMEERASFSPDAMTAMEANLRFAGPETMETRIFGRLTAWQNWIFNRPNAVGDKGALQRYGSGMRGKFDMERV